MSIQSTEQKIEIGYGTGMITVEAATQQRRQGYIVWRCRCDCGAETIVRQTYLQSGKTKSCGCLQKTQILRNLKLSGGTSVTILEAGRKRLLRSNTSGVTGVYQNRHSGRWRAQITFRGKTRYLGSFENNADAVAARRNAEQMFDVFLAQYYAAQNRTT